MTDKQQRITSYKSGHGLTIYEVEQYNASAKNWYIVGDSSLNKKFIESKIKRHNLFIKH